MDLKEFLHMKEGDGELSYYQNSFLQKGVSLMSQETLENAVQSLISEQIEKGPIKLLRVADLGCGVGPVPLALASLVTEYVANKCKELNWDGKDYYDTELPEIEIYYNDLPSNDFNLLFKNLMNLEVPATRKDHMPLCFFMGVPGSYYDRLFSTNSLHLVHANYTLHWLSQAPMGLYNQVDGVSVPINKGNIYISGTSPVTVSKAYLAQFEQDFTRFLKCRSKEVVPNGLMLFTFRGRPSSSNAETWQPWELIIFSHAFSSLVSQGTIQQEKLDSFDFPYYAANKEEIESIVEKEGSFKIEKVKTKEHPVSPEFEDKKERANMIGKFIRAFSEPLICRHLGHQVLDHLYDKVTSLTFQHLANNQPANHYTIVVLLRKR